MHRWSSAFAGVLLLPILLKAKLFNPPVFLTGIILYVRILGACSLFLLLLRTASLFLLWPNWVPLLHFRLLIIIQYFIHLRALSVAQSEAFKPRHLSSTSAMLHRKTTWASVAKTWKGILPVFLLDHSVINYNFIIIWCYSWFMLLTLRLALLTSSRLLQSITPISHSSWTHVSREVIAGLFPSVTRATVYYLLGIHYITFYIKVLIYILMEWIWLLFT